MPTTREQKIIKIKQQIAIKTKTLTQIAKEFNESRGLISDIANGRRWKDVPFPTGYDLKQKPKTFSNKAIAHDPTNIRILDLEAEIVHLKQERDFAKKQADASIKHHGLFKAAVEVIENRLKKPLTPPAIQHKPDPKATINEDLVLHLSDGHHDCIVTPEETGGLESYNFPISCARAEYLIDKIIKYTKGSLSNYNFKNLWILAYGDHTSGVIHNHEKRSYFKNQLKNSLAIGQLHALMFRDLAAHFQNIFCVYIPGNHGRRSLKKDHHGAHENYDYLVAKTAEICCQDIKNIEFFIPNAFSINLEINGIGFNVSHGDDVPSHTGMPFYGFVRRQSKLMALNNISSGPRVRYLCMGHHHAFSNLSDLDGELIVNGAWLATDQYSYNTYAGYREPCQLIHGVHPKYGITWRLPIKIKHPQDKYGPKRYKIDI